MENVYKLRAHHGLCLCFFTGKGYSSRFVENMTNMKRLLEEDPLVCITDQVDAICKDCPNDLGGRCETEEKVCGYDRQVLRRCHISAGEIMSYLDFQRLVQRDILRCGKRKEICSDCEWDQLCTQIADRISQADLA